MARDMQMSIDRVKAYNVNASRHKSHYFKGNIVGKGNDAVKFDSACDKPLVSLTGKVSLGTGLKKVLISQLNSNLRKGRAKPLEALNTRLDILVSANVNGLATALGKT